MQETNFSSAPAIKQIRLAMKVLGLDPSEKFSLFYTLYAVFLNLTVTFYYPLSLVLYIIFTPEMDKAVAVATVTLRMVVCSLRTGNNFLKRKELHKVYKHLEQLDATVKVNEDIQYMEYITKTAVNIFNVYFFTYAFVSATIELPVLFSEKRRLLYAAWFPVDWENSTIIYIFVHAYQLIGVNLLIYQNLISDTYPGILMWLLKGHLHSVGERVKRIGHDAEVSLENNYKELIQCIQDHQICLELYHLCQDVISRAVAMEFVSTEVTLCITAIYILFIGDNLFELLYLGVYFVSTVFEISASCYCGSELREESNRFINNVYSCNWMEQDWRFRKALIVFMQNSQKPWILRAGGVINISLSTWLNVLKSTYSLFAVLS